MRYIIPVLFIAALAAPAQVISVGIKAGAPLTDALPSYYATYGIVDTGRWTIGPTVEFHLYRGLSFEADLLYRGYRYEQSYALPVFVGPDFATPPIAATYRQDTKVWDVPLLLKYRFGDKPWRPFVDAGYTWSHESADVTSSFNCLGTADACGTTIQNGLFLSPGGFHGPIKSTFSNNLGGATVGAGVEFKYGKLKIAPEIRYTRYTNPHRNQATMMVGFTF